MNTKQKTGRFAALAIAALVLALGRAGLGGDTIAKTGAETDPAWVAFQEGQRLFAEKRLGEALLSFRTAAEDRGAAFSRALVRIDAAAGQKEAKATGNSLSGLVWALARRDLIERDIAAIDEASEGSLLEAVRALRTRSVSSVLSGFLDAIDLALRMRGQSRIGDSLALLRAFVADHRSYPEAEYWIGKVYLAEGETRLAQLQFERAYESRSALELPEERFTLLLSLATVALDRGNRRDYEDRLLAISGQSAFFGKKEDYLRRAMESTLVRDGFDAFMALYRLDEDFPREAFYRLGTLYLESGRPQAVIYLAAAVNTLLSRSIGVLKTEDPSYVYAGLQDLLGRIEANGRLARYAEEGKLYAALVLLGEALNAQGSREVAGGIWKAVAGRETADPWNRSAAAALARKPGTLLSNPTAKP
jgi:hypothetical protein